MKSKPFHFGAITEPTHKLKPIFERFTIPEGQKETKEDLTKTKLYDNAISNKQLYTKELQSRMDKPESRRKIVNFENKKMRPRTLPFTGDCTGRKIDKINFLGKTYYPSTWQEALLTVSEELYKRHKDSFQKCLALQGTKMKYFSTNPNELEHPKQIGLSKYHAETKLNANSIVRRSRELMSLFGYGEKYLDIFVL